MGFLLSVIVFVFIPVVLFLSLKIVKNCQKWVYIEMGDFFLLKLKTLAQRAAKHTTGL